MGSLKKTSTTVPIIVIAWEWCNPCPTRPNSKLSRKFCHICPHNVEDCLSALVWLYYLMIIPSICFYLPEPELIPLYTFYASSLLFRQHYLVVFFTFCWLHYCSFYPFWTFWTYFMRNVVEYEHIIQIEHNNVF